MGFYPYVTYDPRPSDPRVEEAVKKMGYFQLCPGTLIIRFGGHGEGFDEAVYDYDAREGELVVTFDANGNAVEPEFDEQECMARIPPTPVEGFVVRFTRGEECSEEDHEKMLQWSLAQQAAYEQAQGRPQ